MNKQAQAKSFVFRFAFYATVCGALLFMRPSFASPKAAPDSAKLYGRIEEISAGPGAVLPYKLRAETARLDTAHGTSSPKGTSGNLEGTIVSGYPPQFLGEWQGSLTIFDSRFSPERYAFDQAETAKQAELTKAGRQGNVTFTFARQAPGQIWLEPAQVIFSSTMDTGQYGQVLKNLGGPLAHAMGMIVPGGGQGLAQVLKSMPYFYALHLGSLQGGLGVTGNAVNANILQNQVRQLKEGVLEQDIVTYNWTKNPTTGKDLTSYGENVIRFYYMNPRELYVQAASVSYDSRRNFVGKVLLYGTVDKVQ